jgi:hypothetical protein
MAEFTMGVKPNGQVIQVGITTAVDSRAATDLPE